MWIGTMLAIACSGFLLSATARVEGPLQGWRGTALGLAMAALAVWRMHASGLGLAEAIAQMLAVTILALPCWSYWQAARRTSARKPAP